jgi:hypothetical protein
VRNIRVLLPGFGDKQPGARGTRALRRHCGGMAAVRFMDFMLTNGSTTKSWSQRPKPDDSSYSRRGVPLELMIDLANRLGADPWFCMPHMADDDYVRNFARVVKDKLHRPRRTVREYSNELWNGIFPQTAYATGVGTSAQARRRRWEAAWALRGTRSLQMFALWEEVLRAAAARAGAGGQAGSIGVAGHMLHARVARGVDALAIAPYFGSAVDQEGAAKMRGASPPDVLPTSSATREAIGYIREHKRLADRHKLRLLAYEAGQHLVGHPRRRERRAPHQDVHRGQPPPRIGALTTVLRRLDQAGGDLLCHFSS